VPAEVEPSARFPPMSARWVAILSGESALGFAQRLGRRFFALNRAVVALKHPADCRVANHPLHVQSMLLMRIQSRLEIS